jgi:hypothetical protein
MNKNVEKLYDSCGCLVGTLTLILCVVIVIAIAFGVFCLEGWVFMSLWNWLAVDLFGAKVLGYWVCVGLMFALHFIKWEVLGYPISVKSK